MGLFLAHQFQFRIELHKKLLGYDLWFNASSDHLYELDTSTLKDGILKIRLEILKTKCINWGHGFPSEDKAATQTDMDWALNEAKELLLLIDKQLLKVSVIESINK